MTYPEVRLMPQSISVEVAQELAIIVVLLYTAWHSELRCDKALGTQRAQCVRLTQPGVQVTVVGGLVVKAHLMPVWVTQLELADCRAFPQLQQDNILRSVVVCLLVVFIWKVDLVRHEVVLLASHSFLAGLKINSYTYDNITQNQKL